MDISVVETSGQQSGQLMQHRGSESFRMMDQETRQRSICQRFEKRWAVLVGLCIIVLMAGFMWYQTDTIRQMAKDQSRNEEPSPAQQRASLRPRQISDDVIGLREESDCKNVGWPKSFADLDYALMGYNILRGYPHAIGHDPGFTLPIFKSDYSRGARTADCQYQVPDGIMVIPDVSCVTSFSSQTVRTRYEFSKMLSTSASVSAGGWGANFGASTEYKKSSDEISSGKYVLIVSRANCNYYFTKLYRHNLPTFHDSFLKSAARLSKTDNFEEYLEFFDTFGTHFPVSVTFGARLMYQYKMSSSEYYSAMEKSVDVEVSASYNSLQFSASADFKLNTKQKSMADNFSEKVETSVISVGAAPPADNKASTWASTVKDSPLPTSYELQSIESLFTQEYMSDLDLDFARIKANIEQYKSAYCQSLKDKKEVESCAQLTPGIVLNDTFIHGYYKTMALAYPSCIKACSGDADCLAISYCQGCTQDIQHVCYMYKPSLSAQKTANTDPLFQSVVFTEKISSNFTVMNAALVGTELGFDKGQSANVPVEKCLQFCVQDAYCVAISYDVTTKLANKCRMFSNSGIVGLRTDINSITYFIRYHL